MSAVTPVAFTADEEARLKNLFEYLDSDKKGFITHDDLRRLCTELGHEITKEKAEELISKADPTKSGKVPWDAFVKTMAVAIPKIIAALILVGLFRVLDTDNTGFISRAELEKIVIESGATIEKSRLDELILKTKPLEDGRIEFRAFVTALVAHLRAL